MDERNIETGIWIKKSAHGKKYGREAVTALVSWARENLTFDHIRYPVVEKNVASRKIPESLGGKVMKKYKKKMLSGHVHDMVEYWIYRNQ